MGEWVGWVYLREAEQNGSLTQLIAYFWAGIGMAVAGIGGGGLLKMLLEAIEEEHLSDKEAAGYLDLNRPHFSAVRAGERPVTIQRLDKLPPSVLGKLGERLALEHLDEQAIERRALLYMALLLRKRRMVKAQIAPAEKEMAS